MVTVLVLEYIPLPSKTAIGVVPGTSVLVAIPDTDPTVVNLVPELLGYVGNIAVFDDDKSKTANEFDPLLDEDPPEAPN